MHKDATLSEINDVMKQAAAAAKIYRKVSLKERRNLMHEIAAGLEASLENLVPVAAQETNLPEGRLQNEIRRTALQLRQYGDDCAKGIWMGIKIDKAGFENVNVDLRKMQIPLGPVVVFGSSNFPFAYSTAGGDTGCALAAGCPVIVKAHPAHAETSQMVADIISKAVEKQGLPKGLFSHVHGISFDVGEWLVKHDLTAAVGFTGSLAGGRQLYNWAQERKIPIPVFSEMGSTNPVFMLPEKLINEAEDLAKQYAASITTGAGQFCTKPGMIFGIKGAGLNHFIDALSTVIKGTAPQKMLHTGIAKAYQQKSSNSLAQPNVEVLAETTVQSEIAEGHPIISAVNGKDFINNPELYKEVFGPYSMIVQCENADEMCRVAETLEGQLTATIIGHDNEIAKNTQLLDTIIQICGRIIINGVPTGVTVCRAMNHGGPYPATTDSRFTSVGSDGIRRFTRPICYQNFPDSLLPDELKEGNPLKIWRTVNGDLTRE